MRKIVLHIGSGKTGTTSIQQALLKDKTNDNINYNFPDLGNNIGNQIIKFAFIPRHSVPEKLANNYSKTKSSNINFFQEDIRYLFRKQCEDFHNIVISSEFLFSLSKYEAIDFASYLRHIGFDEIHVIMYLRDPADYYLSLTQQTIKSRATIAGPQKFKFNAMSAINNWSHINPDTLTIKEFNVKYLFNGNVVKDFEYYLNKLDIHANLISDTYFNTTMSSELCQIFQDFNMLKSSNKTIHPKIFNEFIKYSKLNSKIGNKPALKTTIRESIYIRFHKDIEKLNSEYNLFKDINLNLDHARNKSIEPNKNIINFKDICHNFDDDLYRSLSSKFITPSV
jgi:hypothetical protein